MKQKLHQAESESLVTFGQRLAKLIAERGLTAAALSREIGVSHVAVGNYIKQKAEPSADVLLRIADFFEVNPHWLMLGVGDQKYVERSEPMLKDFAARMAAARTPEERKLADEALKFQTKMMRDLRLMTERAESAELKVENIRKRLGSLLNEL